MLVGWQTLYSEDEKMGAELVPSWSWLGVGGEGAQWGIHTSLLKTLGSRKQNPYASLYHFSHI